MRVDKRSRDSTGISSVSVVANAAIAASSVTAIWGVSSETIWSSMATPQYLKLIILRITSTPMVIQTPPHTSRNWPNLVVQSRLM